MYNLVEVENHWFATYLDYHIEKLRIEILSYGACLVITKDNSKNFGIIGIQIDNIFNIRMEAFIKKEEIGIMEAKFKAKT